MLWIAFALFTIASILLSLKIAKARPAFADLKCGDAPMYFTKDQLVVTWVGPTKGSAKVRLSGGDVFRRVAEITGSDIPDSYPDKYLQNLEDSEVFNSSMAWSTEELTRWEGRYGIEMEPEALEIFERYLLSKHVLFMSLVGHPQVPNPEEFRACSLVLQRGVIVYDQGQEDLFLRSYFHSATDQGEFVNFVPREGVHFAFPSDSIWFPFELTELISEPASFIELDILTRTPLDDESLPSFLGSRRSGRVWLEGEKYQATRISGVLEVGKEKRGGINDLSLPTASMAAG
jgi:hypothetical protein